MESVRLLLVVAVVIAVAAAAVQKAVGDACQDHDGAAGSCRSIADCAEARAALRRGAKPVLCSFDGSAPVVCCPGAPRNATAMCAKYAEAVFRYESAGVSSVPAKLDQCASLGSPIPENNVAGANEFPHSALLGYGDNPQQPEWGCGGSLISERFVLTAAHCLVSPLGIPKIVRLGERDLNATDASKAREDHAVAEALRHPEFKNGVMYNDVGLLRLARDVAFSASVRPACLHTLKEIGAKVAVVAGWGRDDWKKPEISTRLRKAIIRIRETEACNTAFKTLANTSRLSNGIDEESMICSGADIFDEESCKSLSGSPLQVALRSPYCMHSVVGALSFGKPSSSPCVFTRVSHFVPWIESVVWPNDK